VYISKPTDYPHAPARFLLLLTGGTGIKSINNQLQADKFASEGFLVAMPDLFHGDAAPNAATFDSSEDTGSILDTFKLKIVETAKAFQIDMWLARHTEEKVLPILHKVIDGCKEEFADAVAAGEGIYAVGYCIGGRYVLLLGSERQPAGQKPADEESAPAAAAPLIKVGALAHGASVIPSDFSGVKVPISLVCVENDPLFPEEVRTAGEDYMSKANLEHEVRVYPGVPHGKTLKLYVPAPSPANTCARLCRRRTVPRCCHPGCPSHGPCPAAQVAEGTLSQRLRSLHFLRSYLLMPTDDL
jgi:dienelactone hydrolase